MKVKSIRLKDFKRFTDLTVQSIPATAKLVILAGPNGVGKSSLFEAFNLLLSWMKSSMELDAGYHIKPYPGEAISTDGRSLTPQAAQRLYDNVLVEFHDSNLAKIGSPIDQRLGKAFYIRSSYRIEPDFQISNLTRSGDMAADEKRPRFLMSLDSRVSDNYQRIVASATADVFNPDKAGLTAGQISDKLVGEARESIARVLPGLELEGPGNPFDQGTFMFSKGESRNWRYKNLSGGEKAAFDLLLDLIVKKEVFNDTVFCIDEPEGHMNTRVQGDLLRELFSKVPDNCQLWVATHSAGMMRAAKELGEEHPGSVVFLDFGGKDFDNSVVVEPEQPTREFWKRQFEVAIGDLADLLAPQRIVFCEGHRTAINNPNFDARCYAKIFGFDYPDTQFVSLGGTNEVAQNALLLNGVLKELFSTIQCFKLYDRDDRSSTEIEEIEKENGRVLSERDLESYLYDNEILTALCISVSKPEKVPELLAAKAEAMNGLAARNKPYDDVKNASPQIFQKAKRILGLVQCGNTPEGFAVDTLAPLITKETDVYRRLRNDVFGE